MFTSKLVYILGRLSDYFHYLYPSEYILVCDPNFGSSGPNDQKITRAAVFNKTDSPAC